MEQAEVVKSNIKVVQQLYAAFSKGDIEGILSVLCDDVVWSEPENPYNPAGGTRKGHAGFLEWMRIGRDAEDVQILKPRRFWRTTIVSR